MRARLFLTVVHLLEEVFLFPQRRGEPLLGPVALEEFLLEQAVGAFHIGSVPLRLNAQPAKLDVRPHPRAQLRSLDRLGDEVHRSEFQAFDSLRGFRSAADEHDRDVPGRGLGLEPSTNRKAVEPGHADIQQDQVG